MIEKVLFSELSLYRSIFHALPEMYKHFSSPNTIKRNHKRYMVKYFLFVKGMGINIFTLANCVTK